MSEIDIRNKSVDVNVIRFADNNAQILIRIDGDVSIRDEYDVLYITNKEHAEHLILALQEAINRGWFV